jgi:hypothetical protein
LVVLGDSGGFHREWDIGHLVEAGGGGGVVDVVGASEGAEAAVGGVGGVVDVVGVGVGVV